MAEILSVERRRELRQLAAGVTSVEDAHRIIEEKQLHADPAGNHSIFYYGAGVEGAKALSSRDGFVRLEQTERGYFLNEVTRKLAEDGAIPRGSEQNTALFGDKTPNKLGEWGEASRDFAQRTEGCPVVFPDNTRAPERFRETAFFNAELPALSGRAEVTGLRAMDYANGQEGHDFGADVSFTLSKASFTHDGTYGLNESQQALFRTGGETANDMVHLLGGDFGAITSPASQNLAISSAQQSQSSTRAMPSPIQSRAAEQSLSRGGMKR